MNKKVGGLAGIVVGDTAISTVGKEGLDLNYRGLWATRIPLDGCGAHVYPDMFSLASAYSAFDDNGQLKEKEVFDRLQQNVSAFIPYAAALKKL